jgi:hypothetical protein
VSSVDRPLLLPNYCHIHRLAHGEFRVEWVSMARRCISGSISTRRLGEMDRLAHHSGYTITTVVEELERGRTAGDGKAAVPRAQGLFRCRIDSEPSSAVVADAACARINQVNGLERSGLPHDDGRGLGLNGAVCGGRLTRSARKREPTRRDGTKKNERNLNRTETMDRIGCLRPSDAGPRTGHARVLALLPEAEAARPEVSKSPGPRV